MAEAAWTILDLRGLSLKEPTLRNEENELRVGLIRSDVASECLTGLFDDVASDCLSGLFDDVDMLEMR